jgi:hypothetical protein
MTNLTERSWFAEALALFALPTTMTGKAWLVLGVISFSLLFLAGCKLTRAGYESAGYKAVRKTGAFEIRDYPQLTLISTPMTAARPTEDYSFIRLFRYISGANETESKIAMTTPVFTDQAGTNRLMSFVLPHKLAPADVPRAKRDDIIVQTRPAGRFAVYRFSGKTDTKGTASAQKKLVDWVASQGLQPAGEWEMANYDPPFTPPCLRRNEVMVRLQEAALEPKN